MTVTTDTASRRPVQGRRRSVLDPHSDSFHLFADVLYTGVLVFALSLPIVTGFAALSAGVQALREAREAGKHVTVGTVWRPFVDRVARHWMVHLVLPTVMTALLAMNLVLLPYLGLDATATLVVPIVLASAAGAVALRIAGAWRPGVAARASLQTAWTRMSDDAAGSLLLAGAVAAAGAIAVSMPLLALVLPGPLALAAVAMDRSGEADDDRL